MGPGIVNTESKTNLISETLTEIFVSSSQNCSATTGAIQEMKVSDLNFQNCNVEISNISQTGNIKINLNCAQSSTQISDLKNKFDDKLDQKIVAETTGFGNTGYTSTDLSTITDITKRIKNTINMSSIASAISKSMAAQKLDFGKITASCDDPNQKITIKNFAQVLIYSHTVKVVQKDDKLNELENELNTALQTAIENKNTNQVAALSGGTTSSSSIFSIIALFLILPLLKK